jgi:hypothetical protein
VRIEKEVEKVRMSSSGRLERQSDVISSAFSIPLWAASSQTS